MSKTFKDCAGKKTEKTKEIDFCLSCVLVSRQTGITRDCSTCKLLKKKEMEKMSNNGEVIKKFDSRGFGFLKDLNTSIEMFFHFTNCENFDSLAVGDSVTFGIGQDRHGRSIAVNVIKTAGHE